MDNSWIKLHRKLLEWEWLTDDTVFRLWIFILLSANFDDRKWKGKVIPRGSFVTSVKHLSKVLKLSDMKIRRAMKCLENCENITIKATNKFTIISVCNYDSYQTDELTGQQAEQQTNNKQTTNKQQQLKNIKKERNIETTNKSICINESTTSIDMGGMGGMPTEVGQTIPVKPPKTLAEIDEDLRGRAKDFAETLAPFVSIYGRQMVKDFWDYWTEPNKSHTRMRFELERTWDVSRRLGRWSRNNNNMGRTPTTANGSPQQPESRYAAAAAQAARLKQYLESEQQQETIEEYERRQLEKLSGV